METELRSTNESLQRLAAIVQSSDDAIAGKTLEGFVTSWNDSAERIYGYSASEAIGKSVSMLVPPDLPNEVPHILERIRRGDRVEHYETMRVRKDGRRIAVSLTVSPIKDAAGRIIGASNIARDITERKRLEEKIRAASVYARSLIEASLDPLVTISPEGKITDVNKATESATGVGRDHLIGSDFCDFFTEPDRAKAGYEKVIAEGQVRDYPLTLRHISGSTMDVRYNASVYRNEGGEIQGVFAAARDISELQELVGELEQFSYTITHDMRAPLRAMRGFGQLLLDECVDCLHPERRQFLTRIADAARRMDSLITDALNYSKVVRQGLDLGPVDAKALLQGIIETYPQFQPPKAEVKVEDSLPMVLANEAGLTQCFSNLLSNAAKFVRPGQVPKVRVWAERSGDYVRFWFEDNGIGIARRHHDRIFLMFQKLDREYEGTGIGLALVRKVVEQMKGRVGVESEEGKGSRFWIELKATN